MPREPDLRRFADRLLAMPAFTHWFIGTRPTGRHSAGQPPTHPRPRRQRYSGSRIRARRATITHATLGVVVVSRDERRHSRACRYVGSPLTKGIDFGDWPCEHIPVAKVTEVALRKRPNLNPALAGHSASCLHAQRSQTNRDVGVLDR